MPANNCLVSCIGEFACGPHRLPPDLAVMSPFVTCRLRSSGKVITVGNEASPAFDNSICIKSFEYGFSDGHIAKMELIDQQGGAFGDFMDAMVKCTAKADQPEVVVDFSWGWIGRDQMNRPRTVPDQLPVRSAQLMDIDVNYGEGHIKYTITCSDTMNVAFNMREDVAFGQDGKEMHLVDAIRQLCQQSPAQAVNFYHFNESGQRVSGLEWNEGGQRGPKGVWTADSANRLSVISKWVEPFRTKKDRGVVVTVDTSGSNPNAIAIWELKDGASPNCQDSLGTFIANAGQCSNVIEFVSHISWPAAFGSFSSGGTAGGALTGKSNFAEDTRPAAEQGQAAAAGIRTHIVPNRAAVKVYGTSEAGYQTGRSQKAHYQANKIFDQMTPIEADLKIIGDSSPQFVDPFQAIGRNLAIIAINPFQIVGSGNGGCGDWLAQPGCNPILSNRNWMCKGINHAIKDGSYVTTLKVFLDVPSINLDAASPIGGEGSKGYRPRNAC